MNAEGDTLRLYVIRHAKSSWKGNLADEDRPIKKGRGAKDAKRMAHELSHRGVRFDKVVVSTAKRAQMTADIICPALGFVWCFCFCFVFVSFFLNTRVSFRYEKKVRVDKRLYFRGEEDMLKCVQSLAKKHRVAAIFGHNPDFTTFLERFGYKGDDLPTAGVALVEFTCQSWEDCAWANGKVLWMIKPSQLKQHGEGGDDASSQ